MPNLIRRLPSHLIDRIAAGEVIERPASVLKELAENAVDAGARRIEVELAGGGLQRIAVTDDGQGMSPDDARLCLERHATSKLATDDALYSIRTLGFRGEALSSIAAVSRLTLTTRRPEDATALRLEVEGGRLVSTGEVGAPAGTCVDVRDLFFNTPARRKFLRAPATEQAHVVDAALRVVLGAGAGHGLVLRAGRRRLVDVPETGDDATRIRAALGRRVGAVYPMQADIDGVTVSGFVTSPQVDRSDSKGLWFFVNGRYVRDRMLQRALLDCYRGFVSAGRYPVAIVQIGIDPTAVDVNVHPQKLEVRFSDGRAVFRAVTSAVTSVLARAPWLEGEGLDRAGRVAAAVERFGRRVEMASGAYGDGAGTNRRAELGGGPRGRAMGSGGPWAVSERAGGQAVGATGPWGRLGGDGPAGGVGCAGGAGGRDVGGTRGPRDGASMSSQGGGYFLRLVPLTRVGDVLVCEEPRAYATSAPDGQRALVLVDLQAAQRVVVQAQLRRGMDAERLPTHALLLPEPVPAGAEQQAWLDGHWQQLPRFGFEVDPVGPARFVVRSVPAALAAAPSAALARALVDYLMQIDDVQGADVMAALWHCATAVPLGEAFDVGSLLLALDALSADAADNAVPETLCRRLDGSALAALL